MKAVFSAVQLGHAPKRFLSNGEIVPYPDSPDRARALLEGARQAGASIHAARRFDPEVLESVHSPEYLAFLKSAHEEWRKIEGASSDLMPSLRPMMPVCMSPSTSWRWRDAT